MTNEGGGVVPDRDKGAGASANAEYRRRHVNWRVRRMRLLIWLSPLILAAAALGGWMAAGVLIGATGANAEARVQVAAVLAVLLAGFFASAIYGTDTTAGRWQAGAVGERATAGLLRKLERHGWTVLHDRAVPTRRFNLDHLAIGPPGVFYIDSKNWTTRARISQRRDGTVFHGTWSKDRELAMVATEACTVAETMRVKLPALLGGFHVQAVVAVHGAAVPAGLHSHGVRVFPAHQVCRWLRRQPAVWTPELTADIARRIDAAFPAYRT